MRILVVGAGATGAYFGARLAAAGRDVTFLVRPGRAAQLRAVGLRVRGPHGDLALAPRLVDAAAPAGPYDLVLLGVKSYHLEQAVRDMAAGVGPGSVIVPLLNGLRHVELLARRFGPHATLGGVCHVNTTLAPDGTVRQLNERHEIAYGVFGDAPAPARLPEVDRALDGCGFVARRSDRIGREMWEKWVYVATVGAATCLLRGTIGDIMATPAGRDVNLGMLAECAAVAAAAGEPVRAGELARIRDIVTEPGSPAASSLYRDLLGGGAVEADHIVGDLVARADLLGVDVPLLRLAYTALDVHQRRRDAAVGGDTPGLTGVPAPGAAGR